MGSRGFLWVWLWEVKILWGSDYGSNISVLTPPFKNRIDDQVFPVSSVEFKNKSGLMGYFSEGKSIWLKYFCVWVYLKQEYTFKLNLYINMEKNNKVVLSLEI
jgi:hypothetical protein